MTALTTPKECVYLIRDNESGLHKIGMTTNWARRSRELQVGGSTTAVRTVPCSDALKWEKVLHAQFRHKRLPQSEWFRITEDEALPKMQWLVQQLASAREQSRFVVGSWKRAQAGHYYRRRKSSSGHWYTETKTWGQIEEDRQRYLLGRAVAAERQVAKQARQEPGYWPVQGSDDVQWQDKDPRLAIERRKAGLLLGGMGALLLILASTNPAWWLLLLIAVPFAAGVLSD
jgi:hypothetical protein